jgi:hypothetical protein
VPDGLAGIGCGAASSLRTAAPLSVGTPQRSVEFLDRVDQIWTNTNNYLVAVHVQPPGGTERFDAASTVPVEDFAVGIP